MRLFALTVAIRAVAVALLWAAVATAQPPQYRHAYDLFLADTPTGCELCDIPLLLMSAPLEALGGEGSDVVVITTYERDSIWSSEKNVRVAAADVIPAERKVRLRHSDRPPDDADATVRRPRPTPLRLPRPRRPTKIRVLRCRPL
jgi:hypothetical protein